jgi:hypothetical protein
MVLISAVVSAAGAAGNNTVTLLAGMLEEVDLVLGQDGKDDPADVARVGVDAMMRGDGDVVSNWENKRQATIASVTPAGVLAEQRRKMAEPGSAQQAKG